MKHTVPLNRRMKATLAALFVICSILCCDMDLTETKQVELMSLRKKWTALIKAPSVCKLKYALIKIFVHGPSSHQSLLSNISPEKQTAIVHLAPAVFPTVLSHSVHVI